MVVGSVCSRKVPLVGELFEVAVVAMVVVVVAAVSAGGHVRMTHLQ